MAADLRRPLPAGLQARQAPLEATPSVAASVDVADPSQSWLPLSPRIRPRSPMAIKARILD